MIVAAPTRVVVFDLAGTLIDVGSMAPVTAFVDAFRELGVELSTADARGPMGRNKRDHVVDLLALPAVRRGWCSVHGREPAGDDVDGLYERVMRLQLAAVDRHLDVVPGAAARVDELRRLGVLIGATTGYFREAAQRCIAGLTAAGVVIDHWVCADDVAAGRPAPDMLLSCMTTLGERDPRAVVKVGDTLADIGEGRAAGTWTVGVTDTGNEMGCSVDELQRIEPGRFERRRREIRDRFVAAGADRVIGSVADL